MKRNRSTIIFFVLLVVLFVVVFIVQRNTPRPFDWRPTFRHTDHQPFGCAVFDDVLSTSLEDYSVQYKLIGQVYKENLDSLDRWGYPLPEERRRTYMIVANNIELGDTAIICVCRLLRMGHNVVFCATNFSKNITEAFGVNTKYSFGEDLKNFNIRDLVRSGLSRDTIYVNKKFDEYSDSPERPYSVYSPLHPVSLEWEGGEQGYADYRIIFDNEDQDIGYSVKLYPNEDEDEDDEHYDEEGTLFFIATPHLFTNYGILDGDNASYIFHVIAHFGDRPLVRLENTPPPDARNSTSPIRAILRNPALRMALFILLLGVLLMMANAAQRRQRPIPVVTPPANEMLRFTRLIGNLFYQKRDYRDLLCKKYRYFSANIRRRYAIDLDADTPQQTASLLAARMGLPVAEVTADFLRLKQLIVDDARVNDADMRRAIDCINNWKRKLDS